MHRKEDDSVEYVSISEVFPAQIRYSILNMKDKANRRIIKGDAVWNEACWEYSHNNGTSILSEKNALPVVRTSFGYVLVDGHHDVLSSLHLEAGTVPVNVVEDVSDLSADEFWQEAENRGWSYLYTISGEKASPPSSFADLIDDPNRYFAALIARKFKLDDDGSYVSKGAEYPLWVKVNNDIPFIEFKISNALYEAGFVYSPDHMGKPPAENVAERARKILLEAEIEGLRVIPYRIHYEKIKPHDEYVRVKVPGPDIILRNSVTPHTSNGRIKRLQKYVDHVESHKLPNGKPDFSHGLFWLFKQKIAQSRETKYQNAKNEIRKINPVS